MKNKALKISAVAAIVLGSLLATPTAAHAATINDEAGFFNDVASLKSELSALEAERGLEMVVETVPASEDLEASEAADALRGDNENVIAVVIQAETNKLGVSYGERVTYVIGRDSLDKIVDKEMIPLFQEGEYEAGVAQLLESVNLFMALEDGSEKPSTPGINGWFADNKMPLAVAVSAFLLFFAFSFFFITKRSAKKAEDLSDSLAAEKQKRLAEVKSFWDFTDDDVKERFVKAENRVEREAVISEIFDKQTFMDDNARLTNVIGSFLYPGKIQENKSIQYFIDAEARTEEMRIETLALWDSADSADKEAFRNASSETHQEALAAKMFPELNPVEIVSRLKVMVPDAKSVDPNYATYVDERLAEEKAKQEIKTPPKRNIFGSFFGGK